MTFTGACEDRLAIRELIERYADAVNRVDAQAWGDCWAEEAVWNLLGSEIAGRVAIVETWQAAMRDYAGVVFLAMPGAIDVAGDRATARSYTVETYPAADGVHRDCGRYDDALVRTDTGWRFARRSFHHLHRG